MRATPRASPCGLVRITRHSADESAARSARRRASAGVMGPSRLSWPGSGDSPARVGQDTQRSSVPPFAGRRSPSPAGPGRRKAGRPGHAADGTRSAQSSSSSAGTGPSPGWPPCGWSASSQSSPVASNSGKSSAGTPGSGKSPVPSAGPGETPVQPAGPGSPPSSPGSGTPGVLSGGQSSGGSSSGGQSSGGQSGGGQSDGPSSAGGMNGSVPSNNPVNTWARSRSMPPPAPDAFNARASALDPGHGRSCPGTGQALAS